MKKVLCVLSIFIMTLSCGDDDPVTLPVLPPENATLKVTNSVEVTTDENNFLGVDDVLTYTISIKNTGNVTLNSLNLSYNLNDNNGTSLTLDAPISFVSADANSNNGTLLVDETATYVATYTITQSDVDAGGISNSITANASSPEGTAVSDVSDNGDDTDGNSSNDTTETVIEFNPLIIAQFHILNSDGDPSIKYYFDNNGQIDKIYYTGGSIQSPVVNIYDFEFDSEQRLINIITNDENDEFIESASVSYDSQNQVTSIGDRQFGFVDHDPDHYIDLETYYEDIYTYNDIEYTEINYTRYSYLFTCNYMYSSEYNTTTQEFNHEGGGCFSYYAYGYDVNVQNDCNENDCAIFTHDSNVNPLLSTTNLINVHSFLELPFWGNYNPLFYLYSQNNLEVIDYTEPTRLQYNYIFNTHNLPIYSTLLRIEAGSPNTERAWGNYYYQGESIP